ncbi:DUF4258 domain-containing protein [Mitsuaria sp. GD03876]|uniref:DUF4258 domain-containing protein n=1 Tax=Mitsuaria sp. GD03876 TaxID=2975399 RepID=UPI00244AF02B|nr:DUF4258 domain-containing protein [Mitsuaria sp. GD03876]MDH0864581.1 DUF4258 domain-containing protein [Mitsuaria sp. GD03876]
MTFKKFSIPQLERHIRLTAAHSTRIHWTNHAMQRMRQRRVSLDDALECLRKGRIGLPPEEDLQTGHIVCRMQWYGGARDLAVCVGLDDGDPELIVVTVIA